MEITMKRSIAAAFIVLCFGLVVDSYADIQTVSYQNYAEDKLLGTTHTHTTQHETSSGPLSEYYRQHDYFSPDVGLNPDTDTYDVVTYDDDLQTLSFDTATSIFGGTNYIRMRTTKWWSEHQNGVYELVQTYNPAREGISLYKHETQAILTPVTVPVPSAAVLGGLGLGMVGWIKKRKAKTTTE